MNRRDLIRTGGTAVLLVFSFPPFPTGFLACVALVPFILFLRDQSPKRAVRGAYATGLLWASGTLYWIGWATPAGLAGVLLVLPLYLVLFAWLQARLLQAWGDISLWAAPVLWSAVEILLSLGQLGFPWNLLGHTQTYCPVFVQFAEITGVYGVSFGLVLLNVLFAHGWMNRNRPPKAWPYAAAGLLLILLAAIHGNGRRTVSERTPSDAVRIGLVQGNIDPYKKWTAGFIDSNFAVYDRMTRELAASKPDLVVWPETAAPCYLKHRPFYYRWVASLAEKISVPIATGTLDFIERDSSSVDLYNAVILIPADSSTSQIYLKNRLVPFAEKVPYRETFPFLYEWLNRAVPDIGDYTRGGSIRLLSLPMASGPKPFAAVICFESVFPELVRRFVRQGAGWLVIVTNDGWFGSTSGPHQHARIAVLRAIENRIWIARCANTGISEFIDPFGRVIRPTRYNRPAVLTETVRPAVSRTFYTLHAGWIQGLVLGAAVCIVAASGLKRKGAGA